MNNTNSGEFDKIRILIIDDKPLGLNVNAPPGNENPWMHQDYKDYFDFRWLATPEECRKFRDLTWALGECNVPLLVEKGWIPEILAIDYLLLDDTRAVAERMNFENRPLETISPLPSLDEAAKDAKIPKHLIFSDEIAEEAFSERYKIDSWGCFAGGLILSSISDHPCAPVPITRYRSTNLTKESPDTWFFEWLMASQSGGMLRGRGLTKASWKNIIEPGIQNLQERIKQLANFGIITLNLDELSALASGHNQPILTIQSKYGIRRLPTAGLFMGESFDGQSWADVLIQQLIGECDFGLLGQARSHAENLFEKHDKEDIVLERIELSDLLLKMEKQILSNDSSEAKRLEKLKKKFGASIQIGKNRVNGEIQNIALIGDIRHIEVDDWTRKWTALSVIILLLKRFCIAWKNGMPFEEITEPEVYLALCPVARNPIILPFSEGSGRTISANMQDVDRKIGFRVREVLNGCGLDGAERVLLRHLANTLGLTDQFASEYPYIRRFLRG